VLSDESVSGEGGGWERELNRVGIDSFPFQTHSEFGMETVRLEWKFPNVWKIARYARMTFVLVQIE
jgi:hypothetical protein